MDHLKNLTAQLIQENGAIDPTVLGDYYKDVGYYCSLGIPQINTCVHHNRNAKSFLAENPEWQDWKFQMDVMVEWVTDRYFNVYDEDIFLTVLRHNCPACALRKQDNGYWRNILNKGKLLTI